MRSLAVVVLLVALPAAAKKRSDNDVAGAQAAVAPVLAALSDKIAACAEPRLAPDLPKLDVTIRATLDRDGKVTAVTADVTGGAATDPRVAKTRACAEDEVRAAAWPKLPVPKFNVSRGWSFARSLDGK